MYSVFQLIRTCLNVIIYNIDSTQASQERIPNKRRSKKNKINQNMIYNFKWKIFGIQRKRKQERLITWNNNVRKEHSIYV